RNTNDLHGERKTVYCCGDRRPELLGGVAGIPAAELELYMNKVYLMLLLVGVMLMSLPAFAQPARPANPPDISGEWRLESDEDPGALGGLGQPPLGDYLGIPFNDAGRLRAETSAESLWGTPEYQC